MLQPFACVRTPKKCIKGYINAPAAGASSSHDLIREDQMHDERVVKPQLAYTVDEACRQLGCKRTTLYLAISNRELDARKLGSRTIILGASLERYVNSRPPANIKLKSGNGRGNAN